MRASQYILLTEAAKYFPHPPSRSTLFRYAGRGLNGVRLQTARSAGRTMTTTQWIADFIEHTSHRIEPKAIQTPRRQLAGAVRRQQDGDDYQLKPAPADEITAAEAAVRSS